MELENQVVEPEEGSQPEEPKTEPAEKPAEEPQTPSYYTPEELAGLTPTYIPNIRQSMELTNSFNR